MSESVLCPKCLSSRTGDKVGDPCHVTQGCTGVIERTPEWSELVDRLPEPMTCPRRMQNIGPWDYKENLDYWDQFKREHKHRVCSFCGSLHFEDFHKLVIQAAEAPADGAFRSTVNIEVSDKKYKVYVTVPEIRNAHEGGIKFYMDHLPRNEDGSIAVTDEQQAQFKEAVRRSNKRFEIMLHGLHKPTGGLIQ